MEENSAEITEIEYIEIDEAEADRIARESEEEADRIARERRAAKRAKMKRQRRIEKVVRRSLLVLLPLLIVGIIVLSIKNHKAKSVQESIEETQNEVSDISATVPEIEITETEPIVEEEEVSLIDENGYGPHAFVYSEEKDVFFEGYKTGSAEGALYPSEEDVLSTYAILVDAKTGEVIASKNSNDRINPASMTKIMTILVAAERVADMNDTVIIDQSITDYVWKNDCSAVNFSLDEEVSVKDVMYGTILPSGADAALALARYVAGSEEEFVVLMNNKLEELGLSQTAHFTNCTGIYDENHYCTLNDMAMIMKAAVENELAKTILTAHKYTTSITPEHEEGITISNWFLRRIEDKDTHGEVICAKTGFVNQSGCCAASYEISNSGGRYICVTADAWSSWRCIYDHVAIYDAYVE